MAAVDFGGGPLFRWPEPEMDLAQMVMSCVKFSNFCILYPVNTPNGSSIFQVGEYYIYIYIKTFVNLIMEGFFKREGLFSLFVLMFIG